MTTMWGEKGLRWDEAFMLTVSGLIFGVTAYRFMSGLIEAMQIMSGSGFN